MHAVHESSVWKSVSYQNVSFKHEPGLNGDADAGLAVTLNVAAETRQEIYKSHSQACESHYYRSVASQKPAEPHMTGSFWMDREVDSSAVLQGTCWHQIHTRHIRQDNLLPTQWFQCAAEITLNSRVKRYDLSCAWIYTNKRTFTIRHWRSSFPKTFLNGLMSFNATEVLINFAHQSSKILP